MINFFKVLLYKIKYLSKQLNVMTKEDTVDFIINNKCSISRFGDGELLLMMNYKSVGFQDVSKDMRTRLKSIHNTEKCIVCIPNLFDKSVFNKQKYVKKEYKYWGSHKIIYSGVWKHYFCKNKVLGDVFLSRFYMTQRDHKNTQYYVNKLKKIWDDRNIIFVEGEKSRLGFGNDLFDNAKSIKRILCPPQNAFDKIELIKKSIMRNSQKDNLIICALGPTASIIAFELSSDRQVLDLGHIDIEYEWFKMGATKKVAIKNKYVNEVKEGRDPIKVENKQYISQIIDKIL